MNERVAELVKMLNTELGLIGVLPGNDPGYFEFLLLHGDKLHVLDSAGCHQLFGKEAELYRGRLQFWIDGNTE